MYCQGDGGGIIMNAGADGNDGGSGSLLCVISSFVTVKGAAFRAGG